MKIALIGYGKMGQEIEKIARSRGNDIVLIIDIDNQHDLTANNLKKADVAIIFTIPESSVSLFMTCFESGIPVVSGNTGWLDRWDEVVSSCEKYQSAFFWASNFSLGVNLFFDLNKNLARLMKPFGEYKATMTEVHHTRKLDAPSGTAISLADDLIRENGNYDHWTNAPSSNIRDLEIISVREGDVPGIHTVVYDSDIDYIEITHSAKNRRGFALGAVLAAEFVAGKKGIYSMSDLLNSEK